MKYSKIKKQLALEKANFQENILAYLTHYWQNRGDTSGDYYKSEAETFIDVLAENFTFFVVACKTVDYFINLTDEPFFL